MEITAIICEYNPFHNGHMYQIQQARKNGATHIVAIMSGNFVQRGELAFIDKHLRAEIAIKCGADLVIELPVPYSVSSAELFARGAVHIINSIGCVDALSFGSESGDIELLKLAAQASKEACDRKKFKELLSSGISYPSAIHMIIKESCEPKVAQLFESPNNTLAIEYIKALDNINSNILPKTIERKSVDHDSYNPSDKFASASLLRKNVSCGEDISYYVPKTCLDILEKAVEGGAVTSQSELDNLIRYKILTTSKLEFTQIPDASEGLCDRLISSAKKFATSQEIITNAKTKCFTMARIRRVICYLLLGVKMSDFKILPSYARILGFNDRGIEILSIAKKSSSIPVLSSLSQIYRLGDKEKRFVQLDELSSQIFSMALKDKKIIKNEFLVHIKKHFN